ncbi:hypothetical protein GCM10012276_38170 [Nocardioides deserti]|nr:hypothetical protein GCM10012276_38170 [Nocardioides deserti]
MTIVIPMAGEGSRFRQEGYKQPKWSLPVDGRTSFEHAVLTFEALFQEEEFVFVCRKDTETSSFVRARSQGLGIRTFRVVELEEPTSGQAETVYKAIAKRGLDDKSRLYIFNIDTFRLGWTPDDGRGAGGHLDTFLGDGESWSFVAGDPSRATATAEKVRISPFASTGLYEFGSISIYLDAYDTELAARESRRIDGELYVAPLYNHLINEGLVVTFEVAPAECVVPCGVPREYERLLSTNWKRPQG